MPALTKPACIHHSSQPTLYNLVKTILRSYLTAGGIVATSAATVAITTLSTPLAAQETLARELLVQMSRNQSTMLCSIKSFTECMEFTEKECLALSEQAIEQCLLPLPEKIIMSELENDSIEACPKKVYEDAGYGDEKAKACLQKAATK